MIFTWQKSEITWSTFCIIDALGVIMEVVVKAGGDGISEGNGIKMVVLGYSG